MENKQLTNDQRQYLISILKRRQQSNRRVALVLLIISAVSAYYSFAHIKVVEGQWTEMLFSAFIIGSVFFIGIKGLFISLNLTLPEKMEVLSGVCYIRKRRRITNYYINKVNVIIPLAWITHFQKNETYTVEGVFCKGFMGDKQFVVLEVHHLPDLGLKDELMPMLEVRQYLITKLLMYLLIPLSIIAGFIGVIYFLFTDPEYQQKLGDFLLNNSKTTIQLYGLVLLLIIIGTAIVIKKIISRFTFNNTVFDLPHSWKDWLNDYENFLSNEMKLLHNPEKREREAFIKIKDIIDRNKRYKLEYKKYKQLLHGHEKNEFKQAVKMVHVNFRRHN